MWLPLLYVRFMSGNDYHWNRVTRWIEEKIIMTVKGKREGERRLEYEGEEVGEEGYPVAEEIQVCPLSQCVHH